MWESDWEFSAYGKKTCFFAFSIVDLIDNMFLVFYLKAELLWERQWSKAGYFQLLENVTRVRELACNAIMSLKFMGNIRTKVLWILWLKVLEKRISAKTPESIIQACCPTVISQQNIICFSPRAAPGQWPFWGGPGSQPALFQKLGQGEVYSHWRGVGCLGAQGVSH